MKTIYQPIITQLEQIKALRWIELNIGQLSEKEPSVAYPCALIDIRIPTASSLHDHLQACKAVIKITLAFNTDIRTAASAPEAVRNQSLAVYDTIGEVYSKLQGFQTEHFNALSHTSQAPQMSKKDLFMYEMLFETEFEQSV
ncbi:MAG: hypothetical protein ACK5JS_06965 [Mangrovibacterium sp.]